MVEIILETNIYARDVMDSADVELLINNEIRDILVNKILVALDDMAYVDMNYIEANNTFDVKAELVLCTLKDVETNAEMQAQLMASYGLEEDQILEILKLGIDNKEGF